MEAVLNKYHNGKIYTIRSHQTDKYYIGSSCQPLHKRLYKHRYNYKQFLDGMYPKMSSYDIIKYDDHYIELLEEFKCENNDQLRKREGELIREKKDNCVNIRIEHRTQKEWRNDNDAKIKINQKLYRNEHKTNQRQWKEDNKEHVKQYNNNYYDKNKLAVCTKRKENRLKNNEALLLKRTITGICECGLKIKIYDKVRHSKSKMHLDAIKNIQKQ